MTPCLMQASTGRMCGCAPARAFAVQQNTNELEKRLGFEFVECFRGLLVECTVRNALLSEALARVSLVQASSPWTDLRKPFATAKLAESGPWSSCPVLAPHAVPALFFVCRTRTCAARAAHCAAHLEFKGPGGPHKSGSGELSQIRMQGPRGPRQVRMHGCRGCDNSKKSNSTNHKAGSLRVRMKGPGGPYESG